MAKQRNTFAKRQRENDKRHKADEKRARRANKKLGKGETPQPDTNLPEDDESPGPLSQVP
jgi:hypothetical protein